MPVPPVTAASDAPAAMLQRSAPGLPPSLPHFLGIAEPESVSTSLLGRKARVGNRLLFYQYLGRKAGFCPASSAECTSMEAAPWRVTHHVSIGPRRRSAVNTQFSLSSISFLPEHPGSCRAMDPHMVRNGICLLWQQQQKRGVSAFCSGHSIQHFLDLCYHKHLAWVSHTFRVSWRKWKFR